jgi:hypothetical protein
MSQHHKKTKHSITPWFESELDELAGLAHSLRADFPRSATALRNWDRNCAALARNAFETAIAAEMMLDDLATRLRKICLRVANLHSISVYRSPPDHEIPRTSEEHPLDFGYERDIRPIELERRAAACAISPSGWANRHLLFSSGQSALQGILLAARRLVAPRKSCSLTHLGSYFETAELIALLAGAGLFTLGPRQDREKDAVRGADIVIYEPVQCTPEGQANAAEPYRHLAAACAKQVPKVLICDSTLCRQHFDYRRLLGEALRLDPVPLVIIFRSGLKLDQAGLELANVGIVTILSAAAQKKDAAGIFATELRRIRTLTGSGLSFEDINALSVPWFLGPRSDRYADRIFANNAQVATRFDMCGDMVLSHPARGDPNLVAPFSLLQLPGRDSAAYRQLEGIIDAEARRRGILLQRGGSFGFRGHRFQAIVPARGTPFIRLAIGSRADASRDTIIEMLNEFPWSD